MAPTIRSRIIELYKAGTVPRLISAETGYSKTQIHRVLKAEGITRSIAEAKRKLGLDQTFFEKIDTHEKAQVLGFIYADGCVRSQLSAISVAIAEEDRSYIEFIHKAVKYEGEIKTRQSRRINEQNLTQITLCSVKMVKDIIKLGCTPRKSLTLQFPAITQVPEKYWSSFMLGYFEGDGSLSETVRTNKKNYPDFVFTICGTEQFCSRYLAILNQKIGDVHGAVVRNGKIDVLRINGNFQVKRVMDWLYSTYEYTLPRKHQAYKRLIQANNDSEQRRTERRQSVLHQLTPSHKLNKGAKTIYLVKKDNVYKIRGVARFIALEKLWDSTRSHNMFGGGEEYNGWRIASQEEIQTKPHRLTFA